MSMKSMVLVPSLANIPWRAELSRVAQAALRSTSRLQATPISPSPYRHVAMKGAITGIVSGRSHMSTALGVLSSASRTRPTSIPVMPPSSAQQQQPYSLNWANPSPTGQRDKRDNYNISDIEIRRPSGSSYDFTFGSSKEKEESEKRETASEFTSDLLGIDIADITPGIDRTGQAPVAPRAQMRLVPRTGRTVYVKNNVDVARSFKLLAIQVGQNRIRQEATRQKTHERPGLVRKRLRVQRWQRRFKTGFRAAITRVQELTKQGW